MMFFMLRKLELNEDRLLNVLKRLRRPDEADRAGEVTGDSPAKGVLDVLFGRTEYEEI